MPGSLETVTVAWQYRHAIRYCPAWTSCRKKIGWRGPFSDPVSLMTGALGTGATGGTEATGAGRPVCAAAGNAIAKATPIPAATLALPSVINGARWRTYRLCVERFAGAAMYRCRQTAHKGPRRLAV